MAKVEYISLQFKIRNLCESGKLEMTTDYDSDDNQIGYFWYSVKYTDEDGTEIYAHDPSLDNAINSVYATLGAYNTKINIGNLFKGA